MATVNGYTAEHTDDVFDENIVNGVINGSGHLILTKRSGDTVDSGNVVGPTGPSAANPVPWSKATAYTVGAIVGYAGVLWKCTANNTGHPPHLFATEWNPIEGFDYTSQWSSKDAYFISNDFTVAWETFWKTGTSVCSLTSTAGEFETGDQALKVALLASSSQTLYQKEENVVRGGEVVNVIVRAKLRVAAAGATINAAMFQNDIAGDAAPFGVGSSNTGSAEGVQALTTAWKTYMFTVTAVNGKSRAVPYLSLVTGAGAAADILIDRVEISRNKAQNLQSINVPVGTIIPWPSDVIPSGWIACSGNVSRATYPELFALIGVTYGAGDGSTTFGLPNLTGRLPMGKYPGGPYANLLGVSGGESTHVLSIAEMPVHDHAQVVLANGSAGSGQRIDYAGDRAFAGRFPQGTNTDGAGGGAAHNVLNPYTTVNYIIRAVPSASVDTTQFQFFKGAVAANAAVAMAANTNMPFTVRTDQANAWNATNNNWVCPQPGRYRIAVGWKANATAAARSVRILKNGAAIAHGPIEANAASAGGFYADVFDLLPGDTISVQPTVAYTTMQDGAGVENNYLIIETVGLAGTPSALSDSGWINLPYAAGWADYGSGFATGKYRKINGLTYVEGLIKRTGVNIAALSAIATLPAGYWPSGGRSHAVPGAPAGVEGYAALYIDGSGNMSCSSATMNTNGYIYVNIPPYPSV